MDYAIAIDRLMPGAAWKRAGSYAELVATWLDTRALPTEAELIAAYKGYEAELVQYEQVKTVIRNQAQSAVGKTLVELRNEQTVLNALLAILLAQADAIGSNGTIRPLGEWVSLE